MLDAGNREPSSNRRQGLDARTDDDARVRGLHLDPSMRVGWLFLALALALALAARPGVAAVRPPEPVLQLLSASNQLVAAPAGDDHTSIVNALDRLADALDSIVPEARVDITRIRERARAIEAAPAGTDAGAVRTALDAAVHALHTIRLPAGAPPDSIFALRLRQATTAAGNATAAIDPGTPLSYESDHVQIALREATRALFAAYGAAEPFVLVGTS